MTTADTSVIVAAFASWHEHHERATEALAGATRLIAHCALETYSVLTRLPPPHRAPATLVRDFLDARFPGEYLILGADDWRQLLATLPDLGITGGATYDALVATTAARAGATLLSVDRRAAETYQRCGMAVRLLA